MTQLNIIADTRCRTGARRSGSILLLGLLILAGCNSLRSETSTAEKGPAPAAPPPTAGPGKYSHRESQYVFYSDVPLEANLPIFKELSELRDQIYKELKLPPSNNIIQVFLFEEQERYENYMRSHYGGQPVRRAYFIQQPRTTGGTDDLLVFTYRTKHIRQDLRHELTHGLLHSVLKEVPLWLDEGLAEVYELPPENNGVNSDHLEQVRKGPFQPDMARLETLTEVKQMQRPEYCESWAWVHFMVRGKPEAKTVLLNYLQHLRGPNPAGQLLPKLRELYPAPNEALAEHLQRMQLPRSSQVSTENR